jgi:hypothetical protein
MGEVISFPMARAVGAMNYEVTKRELAERWRVSERWIELRMREDGLPCEKDPHSRFVRFNLGECERWRAQRRAS